MAPVDDCAGTVAVMNRMVHGTFGTTPVFGCGGTFDLYTVFSDGQHMVRAVHTCSDINCTVCLRLLHSETLFIIWPRCCTDSLNLAVYCTCIQPFGALVGPSLCGRFHTCVRWWARPPGSSYRSVGPGTCSLVCLRRCQSLQRLVRARRRPEHSRPSCTHAPRCSTARLASLKGSA